MTDPAGGAQLGEAQLGEARPVATQPGRLALLRQGRVVAFSSERCTGEVEDERGRYPFHCVEIADGTRRIAEGTPVVFALRAAHGGIFEAVQLVATPAPAA